MMLPPMIFTNGRLIFPDRVADGLSLRVERREDRRDRAEIDARGDEVIDLAGNFLAPGFIDLHVHGALGRDTMEGTTEAFRAICDYHASGGTTSLLLTTVTAPIDEIVRVVDAIESRAMKFRNCAARMSKVHLFRRRKRGAQRKEFILEPRPELVGQLLLRPERDQTRHACSGNRGSARPDFPPNERGIASSGGHSDAWEEEARAGFERGHASGDPHF